MYNTKYFRHLGEEVPLIPLSDYQDSRVYRRIDGQFCDGEIFFFPRTPSTAWQVVSSVPAVSVHLPRLRLYVTSGGEEYYTLPETQYVPLVSDSAAYRQVCLLTAHCPDGPIDQAEKGKLVTVGVRLSVINALRMLQDAAHEAGIPYRWDFHTARVSEDDSGILLLRDVLVAI